MRGGGGGGGKKVSVCSPFEVSRNVIDKEEELGSVLSCLCSVQKETPKALVFGVNAVNRALAQKELTAVVLSVKEHPAVLTAHIQEGCAVARCGLCEVDMTSEVLGQALGFKRTLAVGLRPTDADISALLRLAKVPVVPYIHDGFKAPTFLEIKTKVTESSAKEEFRVRRQAKKAMFVEKQEKLKQRVKKRQMEEKTARQEAQQRQAQDKKDRMAKRAKQQAK